VQSINPNSHGVGHIGSTLFEGKLLRKKWSEKSFEKKLRLGKSCCAFFFSEGVPLKTSFYVSFIWPKPSNPKSRSNWPAPVRACPFPFLHLNSNPLTEPTEISLPCFHLPQQGGVMHSPEIGVTIVWLFVC
jgi:hypothetical protein